MAQNVGQNLGYVLPRAFIVFAGWAATYWILTAFSTELPATAVYATGVAWVLAGVVCFGYIYKLRYELGTLPHQQAGTAQKKALGTRQRGALQPAASK